ncbi:MAG TPA: helix-turn-helix transcriptional regulator [bacterium]|nr:helix-turn-helix transcriptional regulator [bacterium]
MRVYFELLGDGTVGISNSQSSVNDRKTVNFEGSIVGEFFKRTREERNLSILQVAKLFGFSNIDKTKRNIEDIERSGKHYPEYFRKLAEIYQIPFANVNIITQYQKEFDLKKKELLHKITVEKEKRTELFFLKVIDSLPFLFRHFDRIVCDPDYYFIPMPGSCFSAAYMKSRPELYLGELLTLWKNGKWTSECSVCGGTVYITGAGGSPLSGSGSGWGYCSKCRKAVYGVKHFAEFFNVFLKLQVSEPTFAKSNLTFKDCSGVLKQ